MEEFGAGLSDAEIRAVKGPDFISRLKGFVNVLGPNPPSAHDASDPFYMIRRAILLRSILSRNEPQLLQEQAGIRFLDIDQGVLRGIFKCPLLQTRHPLNGIHRGDEPVGGETPV